MNIANKEDRTMSVKVTIPTSLGAPTATFWINQNKYVLKTGVEIDAPDEVGVLISQYEDYLKSNKPKNLPDVVDVVFTFAGFNGTSSFPGTSNKSLEDIIEELGGRGVEHISLSVKNTGGILGTPYRVEIDSNQLIAYWIGSAGVEEDKYGIRLYTTTLTSTSGTNVTATPMTNIWGNII
jgi:hypothetical protein